MISVFLFESRVFSLPNNLKCISLVHINFLLSRDIKHCANEIHFLFNLSFLLFFTSYHKVIQLLSLLFALSV